MNFTKHDKMILIASFMLIVFMTLVFPALGLTDDGAEESNVPELDISTSTMELVGERPEFPRSPTSGELRYTTDRVFNDQDVLHRDSENVVFSETFCWGDDPANEDCIVQILVFDENDHIESDNHTITQDDFEDRNVIVLEADDGSGDTWELRHRFEHVENWGTDDIDYRVSWEIEDSPQAGGWLDNTPILGSVFATADAIASVVGWLASVFFWFCAWFVQLVINAIAVLIQSIFFGIDLLVFMTGNYSDMISETSGIASFILMIPSLLLSVELMKLGFIFIKILPTT